MSMAPKTGVHILVFRLLEDNEHDYEVMFWHRGRWAFPGLLGIEPQYEPLFWHPLEPPIAYAKAPT